jgi:hemolysin III
MDETAAAHVKPLLRGWSHVVSFPVMLVAGLVMMIVANATFPHRFVLGVYVLGTATMFCVSALYHRGRWSPPVRDLMQKFDRSAIFLAIAGGYTPIAAVCLHGTMRVTVLLGAWLGAAIGIAVQWIPAVPRAWRGASYIIVSWVAVYSFPQLARGLGGVGFTLVLTGGICYTVGALVLALRRPDPWPKVFGFHEIFHAFTVVASTLHFVAISYAVVPRLS